MGHRDGGLNLMNGTDHVLSSMNGDVLREGAVSK